MHGGANINSYRACVRVATHATALALCLGAGRACFAIPKTRYAIMYVAMLDRRNFVRCLYKFRPAEPANKLTHASKHVRCTLMRLGHAQYSHMLWQAPPITKRLSASMTLRNCTAYELLGWPG